MEKIEDVRSIRALAHPLRLELLDLLRFEGPSTATLLAAKTGQSSGSTSYHLRQLARYGYVEETVDRPGRERWWQYRERQQLVADGEDATRQLVTELLSREAQAADSFLLQRARMPEWDEASFFASYALRLTAAELDELRIALDRLLASYRRADADEPPAGALPVRVTTLGYPQPLEER